MEQLMISNLMPLGLHCDLRPKQTSCIRIEYYVKPSDFLKRGISLGKGRTTTQQISGEA